MECHITSHHLREDDDFGVPALLLAFLEVLLHHLQEALQLGVGGQELRSGGVHVLTLDFLHQFLEGLVTEQLCARSRLPLVPL